VRVQVRSCQAVSSKGRFTYLLLHVAVQTDPSAAPTQDAGKRPFRTVGSAAVHDACARTASGDTRAARISAVISGAMVSDRDD